MEYKTESYATKDDFYKILSEMRESKYEINKEMRESKYEINKEIRESKYDIYKEIRDAKWETYKKISEHDQKNWKSHFDNWQLLVCIILILVYGFLFLFSEISSLNKKIKEQKTGLNSITERHIIPYIYTNVSYAAPPPILSPGFAMGSDVFFV